MRYAARLVEYSLAIVFGEIAAAFLLRANDGADVRIAVECEVTVIAASVRADSVFANSRNAHPAHRGAATIGASVDSDVEFAGAAIQVADV